MSRQRNILFKLPFVLSNKSDFSENFFKLILLTYMSKFALTPNRTISCIWNHTIHQFGPKITIFVIFVMRTKSLIKPLTPWMLLAHICAEKTNSSNCSIPFNLYDNVTDNPTNYSFWRGYRNRSTVIRASRQAVGRSVCPLQILLIELLPPFSPMLMIFGTHNGLVQRHIVQDTFFARVENCCHGNGI